jgi:hypothetical protein
MLQDRAELLILVYKICSSNITIILFFVMICSGILGNLINLLVFGSKSLRKSFTFELISRLSLVDLLILVLCFVETLFETYLNTEIRLVSTFFCKADTFLVHFLIHSRNVIFMAIGINSKLKRILLN